MLEQFQAITQDENMIAAQHHTLFIEEVPMRMEALLNDGAPVEGIFEQTGGVTQYKLFIGEFDEKGNGTHRIINKLQQASQDPQTMLELHISSHGGSVDEYLEYYNLIDTLYKDNTVTYLNYGYSAGFVMFLLGTDRIVYEHSDAMMHSYSGGGGGKREDMLNHIKHTDKRIQKFFNGLLSPYFTEEELEKMSEGKDYWLDSEQMLARGIATHIIVNGELHTGPEYLDFKYPERVKARIKAEKQLAKGTKKLAKQIETEALVNEAKKATETKPKKNKK